jgi:DNA recombination protein RmuC
MANEFYLLALFFALVVFSAVYWLNRKLSKNLDKSESEKILLEWLKSQQESSQKSAQEINQRLDNAARVISSVQRSIGEMSEIGRGMKDFQEFLASPKMRGNVGEQVLRELLGQFLPKQTFSLQYSFKSGVVVDAAIKTAAGIIPVDAKFPMENFRKIGSAKTENEKKIAEKEFVKDVKRHIDAISTKYILAEEGTIDYALMYLPSESVYYEVANNQDLFDYSSKKRVLPVSPVTFYAYMKAILMSFEGQKIEAKAKQILQTVRAVQKDYSKIEKNLSVLGRHLQNAYTQMNNVLSSFTLLGQKLTSAQLLEEEEEIKKLSEK